jgi:predicted RNA-binding protein with PUA-like domain
MGIVRVYSAYKPDLTDETGKFGLVDVEYVEALQKPVTLEKIKNTKELQDLPLIKQSRLSVMPVTPEQWACVLELGK